MIDDRPQATVAVYRSDPEAQVAAGALAAAGVRNALVPDDGGDRVRKLQTTSGIRLLVARGDLGRARRILGLGDGTE
jgi:hypothetical protein